MGLNWSEMIRLTDWVSNVRFWKNWRQLVAFCGSEGIPLSEVYSLSSGWLAMGIMKQASCLLFTIDILWIWHLYTRSMLGKLKRKIFGAIMSGLWILWRQTPGLLLGYGIERWAELTMNTVRQLCNLAKEIGRMRNSHNLRVDGMAKPKGFKQPNKLTLLHSLGKQPWVGIWKQLSSRV